jgi:hypothetical protein
MPPRIDLTGQRFGELEVIRLSDVKHKTGTRMWECKCHACGNTTLVLGYALRHGHYKSCGCIQPVKRERGIKRHIAADRIDGTRKSALRVKPHRDSKSGIKGVMWLESRKKWKAYIGFRGRQITLGYFDDVNDAISARHRAEELYHKPYLEGDKSDATGRDQKMD